MNIAAVPDNDMHYDASAPDSDAEGGPNIIRLRNQTEATFDHLRAYLNVTLAYHNRDPFVQEVYEKNSRSLLLGWMRNRFYLATARMTAGTIIGTRANDKEPMMGLAYAARIIPTAKEVTIAKNYLTVVELKHQLQLMNDYETFLDNSFSDPDGLHFKQDLSHLQHTQLLQRFLKQRGLYHAPEDNIFIPRKEACKHARKTRHLYVHRKQSIYRRAFADSMMPPDSDKNQARIRLMPLNYTLPDTIAQLRRGEINAYKAIRTVFSTATDYGLIDPACQGLFFAKLQNIFHRATTHKTAAELVHERIDHTRKNCGLTGWNKKTARPRLTDLFIAKNYLSTKELKSLSSMVLEFLQLLDVDLKTMDKQKPFTLNDWLRYTLYKVEKIAHIPTADLVREPIVTKNDMRQKVRTAWQLYNLSM